MARRQSVRTRRLLLLLLLLLLPAARAAPTDNRTLVEVPTGVATVLVDGEVTQSVRCAMAANTSFTLALTATDAAEKLSAREAAALVAPHTLHFSAPPSGGLVTRNFTLSGRQEGRFYLSFTLTSGGARFRLSASSSVVVVAAASELGWQGIWYELALNTALFLLAAGFFCWRRLRPLDLPVWRRGARPGGLFERANADGTPPEAFARRFGEVLGHGVAERARKFWRTPCSGRFAAAACGLPAAMSMQFHADAGLLFALLSVLSLGLLLPVNVLSGDARTSRPGDTFQQTTLSNVPLGSRWLWVHVGYCYAVAGGVVALLERQEALARRLRRVARERLVGARSVFIRGGLPAAATGAKLRAALAALVAPAGGQVRQVAVVHDLRRAHALLARRHALALELERARAVDAAWAAGALSWSLVCCPGSAAAPRAADVARALAACRPCRYACRRAAPAPECRCYCCACCCPRHRPRAPARGDGGADAGGGLESERESAGESASVLRLLDELDFFPDELLRLYDERACAGRAFVTFDSTRTRDAFLRLVRGRSCAGRAINAVEDLARRLRGAPSPALPPPPPRAAAAAGELLPGIAVTSAPEPADVIWENVAVRPTSAAQVLVSAARHALTLALLMLFSTPTAVLVYIRLDASSGIYRELERRHSVVITLAAAYLPSLLLIAVNWSLLAFLYYLSMSEPAISESRRTKSFLVKGFVYLVVSSVFLPSIGVTVAYLAVTGLEHQEGRGYVGAFLYKVSGTFFISYVCQRAFLGAILDLTRAGERLVLHPWLLARAVTEDERRRATRPAPYPFGHDYALVLSVLLVVLLGTVITPIITPFGALYFSLKFATTKYNFFYVLPFSAGRGHIAQTAHALTLVCLLLFEITMAFVMLQVAGRPQFVAILVLFVATGVFYVLQLSSIGRAVKLSLLYSADARFKVKGDADTDADGDSDAEAASRAAAVAPAPPPPSFAAKLRSIFRRDSQTVEVPARYGTSYADPYKVTLCMWKRFGVNQVRRMASSRTQMRFALLRLRQNAEAQRQRQSCCDRCSLGLGRAGTAEASAGMQPRTASETTRLM